VTSANDFPTAAGLASSASGFAALAMSGAAAYGLSCTREELSAIARESSVSAARSLFGGFVELGRGEESAQALAPAGAFDLAMAIALTVSGPKAVGSTEGMLRTAATSPYYPAWVERAPDLHQRARKAVLARDLEALGEAMEQSALMMHASMFAARPALIYFAPATLAVVASVRSLRESGTSAYFTMDAGPHVKVVTRAADVTAVADALRGVPGVQRVLTTKVGPDARLVTNESA
jgi:diphosphomevalonate decarboxylase